MQGPGLGERSGCRAGLGRAAPALGNYRPSRQEPSEHTQCQEATDHVQARRIGGRKWEEAGGSARREPGWSHTWEAGRPVQGEKEGPAAGMWPCPGTWSGLTAQRTVLVHRARWAGQASVPAEFPARFGFIFTSSSTWDWNTDSHRRVELGDCGRVS